MSPEDFRRSALALPGAAEASHMGTTDFRVGGKIFATLGHPDAAFGMVKLDPPTQEMLVAAELAVFTPVKGGWGRQGSTLVSLNNADEPTLRSALEMAWRLRQAPRSR